MGVRLCFTNPTALGSEVSGWMRGERCTSFASTSEAFNALPQCPPRPSDKGRVRGADGGVA